MTRARIGAAKLGVYLALPQGLVIVPAEIVRLAITVLSLSMVTVVDGELGLATLPVQPDPAIPTTAQAADVASAVLSKMRLMGKRGVILIPPNCGQELFDVVQVSDSQANQSAVTFRVVGLRFEYNPKQARYQHRLILGAP